MDVAKEVNLDPVLLIAVMAIESNFNPNAQSGAGAQGLMQVMTRVHLNKYAPYGGPAAAFKPEANIRVGAYILKYYIAQAGSLTGGLRYYVGGPAVSADGGYVGKVLRERDLLIGMLQKGDGSTTASTGKSDTDI
jgi:soluble lytic murein transglycosylase-like protein